MKRCIISIILIIFLPLFLFLMAMMFYPTLRFNVFRGVTELPAIATYFSIRKYIKVHDFVRSAEGLDRELWVLTKSGTSSSSMIRGLIRNTEMVIGSAELTRDFVALKPFLERFVNYNPKLFLPRLWLAEALTYADPKAAFPYLEKAVSIVPADDRAYRLAIKAALSIGDFDVARSWCKRYYSAKFGGTRPLIYRNIFAGTGLRKIALEIPGGEGVPIRVPNEGVVLGERQTYSFDLIKRVSSRSFRLHLGLMPGTKVTLDSVTLFGPSGITTMDANELVILPERGFVFDSRSFITTSRDGDIVSLSRRDNKIMNVDRVDLKILFSRIGLTTLPGCIGER